MANRTDPLINSVSGSDPQNCLEYITRQRIYDCRYWKEVCFGLNVTDVLEKAAQNLQCIGALPYTKFLSLTLKLLQLNVEHDVIQAAFVEQDEFKYARSLGALYIRLTSRPAEIYQSLEPLYHDYRKLRIYKDNGNKDPFSIWRTDEYIHKLLTSVVVFGITLPRLPSRKSLQDAGYLPEGPRATALRDVLQQYCPISRDENDDDDKGEDDTDRDVLYESAINYLKYKAFEEKCPAAIDSWQRRQTRLGVREDKSTVLNLNQRNCEEPQQIQINESPPGINSEARMEHSENQHKLNSRDEPEAHARKRKKKQSSTSNADNKERNYKFLFKATKSIVRPNQNIISEKTTSESAEILNENTAVQEGSEDYWNEQRLKLGLKLLKK